MASNKDAVAVLHVASSASCGGVDVDSNQNKGGDCGDARSCGGNREAVNAPTVPLSVSMISSGEDIKTASDPASHGSTEVDAGANPAGQVVTLSTSSANGSAALNAMPLVKSVIQGEEIPGNSIRVPVSVLVSSSSTTPKILGVPAYAVSVPAIPQITYAAGNSTRPNAPGLKFVSTTTPAKWFEGNLASPPIVPGSGAHRGVPMPAQNQEASQSMVLPASNPKPKMEEMDTSDQPGANAAADLKVDVSAKLPTVIGRHVVEVKQGVTWSNPVVGSNGNDARVLAELSTKEFTYQMRKYRIVVGRNSVNNNPRVDVNMGKSSFISREHVEIHCVDDHFYMVCVGKNGVFLNEVFCKKDTKRVEIPKECVLRFPSTHITIRFQSLLGVEQRRPSALISPPVNRDVHDLKTNLKIHIPERGLISPCLSPAGTISAANSAPASPHHIKTMPDLPNLVGSAGDTPSPASASANLSANPREISVIGPPGTAPDDSKPPFSYAQLIVQSISSAADKQLTLSGIYAYITKKYPYYRSVEKGWQNSIRHNLSLNRYFHKVPRSQEEPGKGSFWRIDPASEMKLVSQAFRRRRQRGVPCFRTPYGAGALSTRSAPSSPSHVPGSFLTDVSYSTTGRGPNADIPEDSPSGTVTPSGASSGVSTPTTVVTSVKVAGLPPPLGSSVASATGASSTQLVNIRHIQSAPGSPQNGSPH